MLVVVTGPSAYVNATEIHYLLFFLASLKYNRLKLWHLEELRFLPHQPVNVILLIYFFSH